MANYPYQPQYQPQGAPMYGNPYGQQVQPQQYVNIPYYQPQYQPQQQKPAPLMGRVVSSLEEITVGDVPNDGSVGWFPAADGSCVFGKRWAPNGTITTVRYVPEQQGQQEVPQIDPISALSEKMDQVIEMVEQMRGGLSESNAVCARDVAEKPASRSKPKRTVDVGCADERG